MNISARVILAVIFGALIITALTAPLLRSNSFHAAAFFTYLPFSFFCHQMPERSFMFLHHPLAVCHRCSGIYLGLFLGTLLYPRMKTFSAPARKMFSFAGISSFFFLIPPRARRKCILLAASFLALDALLPFTGLWNGFWLSRFLTGLVFGVVAAPFAVAGLDEIIKMATSENLGIKACDRDKSGVYTKVNEHFVEGA